MGGRFQIPSAVLAAVLLLGLTPASARAAGTGAESAADATDTNQSCNNADVLSGKLLSHICWDCMFPIVVGGAAMGGSAENMPEASVDKSVCACKDNQGVYNPGVVKQMWEPARLVELVREPGCSPSLGGATMPVGNEMRLGGPGEGGDQSSSGKSFYHYHYLAFPLMLIMDLVSNIGCNADGYMDVDMMYMSELDPTWNESDLAFYANPESAIFANPVSIASCTADAAAASAGEPIDSMFWCAGSWGNLYPLSGHASSAGLPETTSRLAARALAAQHRRGLARQTMGEEALCEAPIDVFLPKSQYKITMFYPQPEAEEAHVIGESSLNWAAGKTVPGAGDAVYVIWRWKDCCMSY